MCIGGIKPLLLYILLCHRIVLRNHIAQKAVEMAEQGDYSEVIIIAALQTSP